MIPNQPSRTALGAAMYRAAHQLVDHPVVFKDPLALPIIGHEAEKALRAGRERWTTVEASSMRAFIAARSRYTEDCFVEAFKQGVRQYVVLGAGLDTFAYRMQFEGVRVFEVDHPATQVWKRECLTRAAIAVPGGVAFAPVDFEQETILEGLLRVPFDSSQPAFFAWLGVTPYLELDALERTLSIISSHMKRDTEILFDFAAPRSATSAQKEFARNSCRPSSGRRGAHEM